MSHSDSVSGFHPNNQDSRNISENASISNLGPSNTNQLRFNSVTTPGRFLSQQYSAPHHLTQTGTNVQSSQILEEAEPQVHIWGTNIDINQITETIKNFVLGFSINEKNIYQDKLLKIASLDMAQHSVLEIEGQHIYQHSSELYYQLVYFPGEIIRMFDQVVDNIYQEQFNKNNNENNSQISNGLSTFNIIVGIVNLLDKSELRSLDPKDINHLIEFRGVVIRMSDPIPEMKSAYFRCAMCGNSKTVVLIRSKIEEPNVCGNCQSKHTFEIIHNLCDFTDKQYIKLQENPDCVPEGATPQTITLVSYDDNVDKIKPGDRISIIGIFRATPTRVTSLKRTLKALYNVYLDVVSFDKNRFAQTNDDSDVDLQFTTEEKKELQDLADSSNIYDLLVNSFAPSIYENFDVKKGVLCQLFGGNVKDFKKAGRGRFRSEINVLLVGDPSVAKSQIIQFVHKIAPRGIYTSGKGSSAVGLTAYVTKDPDTREIVLESGALVLSDMGICCIDEFDKMDDKTRSILHEAMESQTISIAKSGIIATLNSRTAILAGANPIESKYNPKKSVVENINLQCSLLSRFDLIYILLDQALENRDRHLAQHIMNLYISKSDQMEIEDQVQRIPRNLLKKYISYARKYFNPTMDQSIHDLIVNEYTDMRQTGSSKNVITSTPRQLESIIRLSESLAKMRFSNQVEQTDVIEAVRLIKVATRSAATDPITGVIDMDMITTGITAVKRERIKIVTDQLEDHIRKNLSQFQNIQIFIDVLSAMNREMVSDNQISSEELLAAIHRLHDTAKIQKFGGDSQKPKIKAGSISISI